MTGPQNLLHRLPPSAKRALRPLLRFNLVRRAARWLQIGSIPEGDLRRSLFAYYPLGLVVHVGAHLGEEAWFYEALGARTVVWIEADPELHARLVEVLEARPAGETKHIALQALVSADNVGVLSLRRYSNDGASNSVYGPTRKFNEAWPSLEETGEAIVLPTHTLRDVLNRASIEIESFRRTLLVVDVQGHELAVLQGAGDELLGHFDLALLEVSSEAIYDGGAAAHEVMSAMRAAGFVPEGATPQFHGDLLFRNESMPSPARDHRHESYYPESSSCQIPNLSFLYEKFLGRKDHGFFVEVGAYDGLFVSNSWGLAERGWGGLLIEAQEDACRSCQKNHRRHPNVRVIHSAVGAPGQKRLTLVKAGALTTANSALAWEYAGVQWSAGHLSNQSEIVRCTTLDKLLESNHVAEQFDVLIVDVEGFEAEVFSGFDLMKWRPQVLVIELADVHPDLHTTVKSDARLLREIQEAGYQIAFKDQVNTVFVRIDRWIAAMSLGQPAQKQ